MARRIKHRSNGKKQTHPIKDKRKIQEVMRYLDRQIEFEMRKGRETRLFQARRNRMLVLLGFNTAFRAEDLLQLLVKEVIDGRIMIKENKTGKTQCFRLNKSIISEIRKYVEEQGLLPSDYMFPSQRSDGEIKCISRQQADRVMKQIKDNCNIDFTFGMHSLRKTFGYQFYANGGDIETLRMMYNHYDSGVTKVYIMWDRNDMEKAREEIVIGIRKGK